MKLYGTICAIMLTLAIGSVLLSDVASAANILWDGTGTTWNSTTPWSQVTNATTPDPPAKPGAADVANFNITTVNTAQTVNLDAAQSALGLVFNSTGTVLIECTSLGGSANSLTLGASGITHGAGAGADTISAPLILSASQQWVNNSSGIFTASGGVNLQANGLTIDGAATTTFSSALSGTGGVTKNGSAALRLNASNTFTGGVTIDAGPVILGNAGALNSTTPNAVSFGANSVGALTLNGNSVTVSGLTTNATVGSPFVENKNATPATLTVNNSSDDTYAGALQDSAGGGALSLTKTGAGTLTLNGNNQYTGATTVSDGTLLLGTIGDLSVGTGTAGATSAVNINGSGSALIQSGLSTLTVGAASGGTGAINIGTTTGGTLTTGTGLFTINKTGAVNIGSATTAGTLNANGDLAINGGTLSLAGGSQLNLSGGISISTSGGAGTLAIQGAASSLTQSGSSGITVGSGTDLNIGTTVTGGMLTTGTGLFTTSGNVNVGSFTTTGTLNANGDVTIDHTVFWVHKNSNFLLAAGKTFTVRNLSHAMFDNGFITVSNAIYNVTGASSSLEARNDITGGSIVINNGAQVNVSPGALLSTNSIFIDGASSVLQVANSGVPGMGGVGLFPYQFHNTYSNDFVVQNGGRASFDFNGGDYTTPYGGASNYYYTYNVTGTDSKWEFVDGSGLAIDNGDQVNVTSGGLLSAAGDVSIGLGTLTINQGTLIANALSGPLNFASGTVGIAGAAGVSLGPTSSLSTNFSLDPSRTLNVTNATTIPIGSSLTIDGGTFNTGSLVVNGAFSFNSGTLGITGPAGLTVAAGGLLGSTVLLDATHALHVTNTLTVKSGAKLTVYLASAGQLSSGNLVNNGDLVAIDAALGGPVVNNSAVTVVGLVDFNGLMSGPGRFYGPGTAHFNGGLSPGASPANVSFEGNLALADMNTLFIEIGGTTPGSQYDRLTIAGSATLDGALNLSLINGFTPSGGQQFTILTAGSIVDNGFVLTGSAASLFNLVVNGTSVMLQAIGLAGDYNGNGVVDAADYTVWRDHLGQSVTRPNDTTPGSVTQADYDVWKSNFGAHAGAGAAAAVPEPTTLVLLTTAMLPLWFRRRRVVS